MSTVWPALWMRGGTSKGLFLNAADLPAPGAARDRLLARALGSPDPYGRQTDGLGGATSSTSKVVLLQTSSRPGHDVDYWFGQVDIATGRVDAAGNCGNLAAAVGPAAIWMGLVAPPGERAELRIWQVNLGQTIRAGFGLRNGVPLESGTFQEDGVPFPGARVDLDFEAPESGLPLLPTGRSLDRLVLPDGRAIDATLLTAGNPTVFVRASDLGLDGRETATQLQADPGLLRRLESIRAAGAVAMGLAGSAEEASLALQAVPKVAWVAPAADMPLASGGTVPAGRIDLCARILSMGRMHHAFTGTGAIAAAVAAQLPGSLVREAAGDRVCPGQLRLGHASGTMSLSASVRLRDGVWVMERTGLSRSARRLMQGVVFAGEPQADDAGMKVA